MVRFSLDLGALSFWCCAVVFALRVTTLDASGRPCAENDWRFSFGECSPGGHRNVYAYPAGTGAADYEEPVCDPHHAESVPKLAPLLNVSCKHRCPSGSHLGISFAAPDGRDASTVSSEKLVMAPQCKACPAGKFSMGGGILVSGVAGDWRRRWPVELQSTCMYRDLHQKWLIPDHRRHACAIHVEAPASIAGSYDVAVADWNGRSSGYVAGAALGTLVMAEPDPLACSPVTLPALPDGTKDVVLLVRPGGCLPKEKAQYAAQAGAHAVLLISHRYEALPTVPSGDHVSEFEPDPDIPLFALAREDGEILQTALLDSAVLVNITSLTCEADGEASWNVSGTEVLGCNPWRADPSGRFIHSGSNFGFHQIVSILSMQVHLVRDGHLIFRYNVDAEKPFDGLSFQVDWNIMMPMVSKQAAYTDVHVNLTAGPHVLRWMYQKDYSTSEGRDTARIQLIEVVGTTYTDLECRGCHSARTHSGVGAAHCNICGIDEFLEVNASTEGNLAKCSACPPGRWSPPGSLGVNSCRLRRACGPEDVETSFTPCAQEKRYKRRWWRVPVTCDPNLPGAKIQLGVDQEVVACEACQPNEHRPDGNRCVPKFVTCPKETYAVRELIINQWQSWPRNFSHDVWTLNEDSDEDPTTDHPDDDHPTGHSWRLDSTGAFAYAGEHPGHTSGAAPTHDWFGDALLHLDVALFAAGEVMFVADISPPSAWGHAARFLVDGAVAAEPQVEWLSASRIQAFVPLAAGRHQLTWVWQYHETGVQPPPPSSKPRRLGATSVPAAQPAELTGIHLRNVTVVHAVGAGASRCSACLEGHEVSEDGHRCDPCKPGSFRAPGAAEDSKLRCAACPEGSYSSQPGATSCQQCGEGLTSLDGAAYCTPMQVVRTAEMEEISLGRNAKPIAVGNPDDLVTFNVTAVSEAWQAATGGVPGPFELAGRHYVLGLFRLTAVPGDDNGGQAYAWEQSPREAQSAEVSGNPGDAACHSRVSDVDYDSLGSAITYVRGVASGLVRGVRVTYAEGDSCGSQMVSRGASILFKCALDAADVTPAYRDAEGFYHMSRLRLGASSLAGCRNITLEWPTRAACPLCRFSDFKAEKAECGEDGYRDVKFVQKGPCVGGQRPEAHRQSCAEDAEAKMKEKEDGAKWLVAMVAIFGALLAVLLIFYACYLHCKYQKYVEL